MGGSTSLPPVEIELTDYLTATVLDDVLKRAALRIPATGHVGMVVDCLRMTGYDAEARSLFVAWNSQHKKRIRRVAVITDKALWHVVVSAMALASRQHIKAFYSRADAVVWASEDAATSSDIPPSS